MLLFVYLRGHMVSWELLIIRCQSIGGIINGKGNCFGILPVPHPYYNKYLKGQNVKHIKTSEHSKANYAEPDIRTIKDKLARYMVYDKSRRWINVLTEVMDSYNTTYHRMLKMTL